MKSTATHIKTVVFIILCISLQIAAAQTTHKKAIVSVKSGPAIANYIAHEIAKKGPGDHGIFFDTIENKIKPTDALNSTGKQYQDIKMTLEAGDAIKISLTAESIFPMALTLLSNVNGRLAQVNAIIDTAYSSHFRLLWKAPAAGTYILRVTCKKKAPKEKDDRRYYYENNVSYKVDCVISTPASGKIMDNPTVCDELQFLLRQRLTNDMQITGALSDTTMDVLDKKKIQSVNYLSTFSFYKNSPAKINISPGSSYVAFEESLFYNSDADAAQAQRYFISQFKACLDEGWTEEVEPNDANWHKFKKEGEHNSINIILYPGYKFVEILI